MKMNEITKNMCKEYRFILIIVFGLLVFLFLSKKVPAGDASLEESVPRLPEYYKEATVYRFNLLIYVLSVLAKEGYYIDDLLSYEQTAQINQLIQSEKYIEASILVDRSFLSLDNALLNKTPAKKLPPRVKQIEVLLDQELGPLKNILGVSDPPISPISNERRIAPGSKYKDIGVKYVKFGWETEHYSEYVSLDSIFIDNWKNVDDKSNYDFRLIDQAMAACLTNDIIPIFMLGLDINCFEDNCGKGYPKRTVSADGYAVEDIQKWVGVAINVIKHFNGCFEVSKQSMKYSQGDVRYFSLWDEPSDYQPNKYKNEPAIGLLPLWTGNFDKFWKLYKALVDGVEKDAHLSAIKNILKLGGPCSGYGKESEFRFANKIIETKTRLDFINQDDYINSFWDFLEDPTPREGIVAWQRLFDRIKRSNRRYRNLEWCLGAFNFSASVSPFQGFSEEYRGVSGERVNYETHYGAALLMCCLIYAEKTDLSMVIWHGGQGDYAETPAIPIAYGTLFSGRAKLTYPGLTYKVFSQMVKKGNGGFVKVQSKGEEIEFTKKAIELKERKCVGYDKQRVIQVLSAKSEDKKNIKVLIGKWNKDQKRNKYNKYNIIIRSVPSGCYSYKVIVVDGHHNFPVRCEECPTWDLSGADINMLPKHLQNTIAKYEKDKSFCSRLISLYCPKNDQALRNEDGLGICVDGIVETESNCLNLSLSDVESSSIHLIELNRVY